LDDFEAALDDVDVDVDVLDAVGEELSPTELWSDAGKPLDAAAELTGPRPVATISGA